MIGVNDAVRAICESYDGLKSENIGIYEACGRVLSNDIISRKNLPSFDNSALDGYAFDWEDRDEELEILEPTIFAGEKRIYDLKAKSAYKIMTGAPMPKGANSVLRVEDAEFRDNKLIISQKARAYDGNRKKGEELEVGALMFKRNEILDPKKILALATQGIDKVEVFKIPTISVFSSGDELVEIGEFADEMQIYNANSAGILALLRSNNFIADYKGIIKDTLSDTIKALNTDADIIITSGGASVGDKDYMSEALSTLGFREIFSHIDIRPGRPTKCYVKENRLVFVLPGNPMAAYMLTHLVILNALNSITKREISSKIKVKFRGELKLKAGRENIVFGNLENGEFMVFNDNKFGSGMVMPLIRSNYFFITQKSEIKNLEEIEISRLY